MYYFQVTDETEKKIDESCENQKNFVVSLLKDIVDRNVKTDVEKSNNVNLSDDLAVKYKNLYKIGSKYVNDESMNTGTESSSSKSESSSTASKIRAKRALPKCSRNKYRPK